MIDEQPIKDDVKKLAGLTVGEEVYSNGEPTGEVIVQDLDKDGNVIGWHKETK